MQFTFTGFDIAANNVAGAIITASTVTTLAVATTTQPTSTDTHAGTATNSPLGGNGQDTILAAPAAGGTSIGTANNVNGGRVVLDFTNANPGTGGSGNQGVPGQIFAKWSVTATVSNNNPFGLSHNAAVLGAGMFLTNQAAGAANTVNMGPPIFLSHHSFKGGVDTPEYFQIYTNDCIITTGVGCTPTSYTTNSNASAPPTLSISPFSAAVNGNNQVCFPALCFQFNSSGSVGANAYEGDYNDQVNGQRGLYGISGVNEPVVSFGSFSGWPSNADIKECGFDVDSDASVTSGAITGAFVCELKNASSGTIPDAAPVKAASATAGTCTATNNQICPAVTTDTGAGVIIGVNLGSCLTGAVCRIAMSGFLRNKMIIGTGTCALGNDVINDTTTTSDIKCVAAGTAAGSKIGTALSTASPISIWLGISPTGGGTGASNQVITSNFTTSATTLATAGVVTGLNFTAPITSAVNLSFSCKIIYSQATAAAADLFGFTTAGTAPTNLQVWGQVYTAQTGTQVMNNADITTATSTTVVTATPGAFGAIGTNADMFQAEFSGTLEAPSSATPTQVGFAVASGSASDALTVYRGSYCRWY
jgi:hypothetical protein